MSNPFPTLNAGDLNQKIEILRAGTISDGKGGFTEGWQVIATPWAEVLGQNGREAVIQHTLLGVSTYRIRIRWRGDLKADDQIRLGGAGGIDLNLTAPPSDPTGRREQLMIFASTAGAEKTS